MILTALEAQDQYLNAFLRPELKSKSQRLYVWYCIWNACSLGRSEIHCTEELIKPCLGKLQILGYDISKQGSTVTVSWTHPQFFPDPGENHD